VPRKIHRPCLARGSAKVIIEGSSSKVGWSEFVLPLGGARAREGEDERADHSCRLRADLKLSPAALRASDHPLFRKGLLLIYRSRREAHAGYDTTTERRDSSPPSPSSLSREDVDGCVEARHSLAYERNEEGLVSSPEAGGARACSEKLKNISNAEAATMAATAPALARTDRILTIAAADVPHVFLPPRERREGREGRERRARNHYFFVYRVPSRFAKLRRARS